MFNNTAFRFIILVSVCGSILSIIREPRIFTRNGDLSISVDVNKDINLMVSGKGRLKVNNEDIVQLINSVKNVSNLINKFSIPSSRPSANTELTPWPQEYSEKIDTLQQDFNNYTLQATLEFTRVKRRLNVIQRNIRNVLTSLATNECDNSPCLNGATCQDLYKDYSCKCLTGWEGVNCQIDVNECAIFAGTDLGCQNGATCTNKPGTYECSCAPGFRGVHCTTKSVDCYSVGKDLCGHGSCVSQATGYKCLCDQGWTTDGKNSACTVDVNECESNKLPCSTSPLVQCINVPGSFYCGHCPPGYSGNGYYCNDIDECAIFNGGCSMNPMVQCINTQGSRTCGLCPPGYMGNGVTCSYQGSVCAVNNGGCNPLAQCRDNPRISASYVECICPSGYTGNGIGPNGCAQSSSAVGPCNPDPCVFGICSVSNATGDYICLCRRRYTGRNCDIKKNTCLVNPCLNGGTCFDVFGLSYRCRCTTRYTGTHCQTEKQECGGKLEGLDGVLQFPMEQTRQYNHALNCAWLIQTNASKVLNITFTKFDVEDSTNCQYDWVQIHDGRNSAAYSLGRFCGLKLPKGGNIITSTNLLYLWFRSDGRLAKYGFALNWTTIDPVCGGTIKASSYGTIQSPGYPGNYPLNRDCYWKITVDKKNRLEFHFFTLMIGNDQNCTGDYLEFYYDSVNPNNRFAQFCSTTQSAPLTSPSNNVIVYFHSDEQSTHAGFQISYKTISGIPSCGGTFTTRTGQIISPVVAFSSMEMQLLECEYNIKVENQLRIKIEFTAMKLYKFASYCSEYVLFYDGPTKESPLIGKYCGETLPPPYLSLTNEMLIVYKGRRSNTFTIKYDTVCGRKYTEPTGQIMSPDYPNVQPSNINCVYEIEQPVGTVIDLTLVEYWTQFSGLRTSKLEVRDGNDKNSPLLRAFTSSSTFPTTITSTHNYLKIFLYAIWLKINRKYSMNYTTRYIGCGGIFNQNLGTIKSPNHPGLYPNEASCAWLIQAPDKHVVQLTFLNFKLEQGHTCNYDYVKIYDVNDSATNGGLIGTFCGSKIPPTLISASNALKVVFKADSTHASDGFLASYVFVSEENVCGGTYFTDAGTIKSPRYPNPYPVNRDCKWIIHVQPGRQIMLNVTDFHLESYSNCRYDFLEIRNGGTAASPLVGKYCGLTIPRVIYSHANQLFLHFKTDMTRNAKGFMIYWSSASTGCGGMLTSPKGSIISPHYPEPYSKNTECYWKIAINAGSVIQIVFADLELEPHATCTLDYVEVFDGKDMSAKSFGRFCSSHPPYIRSTSNYMMVQFRSDVSFQGRGFQIQYSTVCENTLTGFSGVIESPNFPSKYPQNEDCTWTIGVSEGNKINITFSHFELERSISSNNNKCQFDYVEFIYTDRDTENEIKTTYCGITIPPGITINSNTTKVHFVSDHLLMGNGFRLEWQIVGCGGILTHPKGSFQSPNYPNHYPASTTCDWIIEAPYGNSIAVTFASLDVEPNAVCSYDAIQIYNGPDDKSPLMAELCHSNKPITITSSGHNMLARFVSDSSYEGSGFEGTYETVPSKCGGTLRASQGQFTSPNYPKNYEPGTFCEWLIEIEENHVIELRFLDLDLVKATNMTYIKVYDGPSSAYSVLAYLQGDNKPNGSIKSTYNHLFVQLVTSSSTFASKGFKASYAMACGAILNSETTGVIEYNPIQSLFAESCQWTIMASDLSQHVSLTISHVKGYYCDFDIHWIVVYNGFNVSAPEIGTYCEKVPSMLVSTGSMLHIVSNMGFKATYSTLSTTCGGSLENEKGDFATPNYPNNYPVNIECEWIVNISDSMRTSLRFYSFDLVSSEHCNDDYLEIREGGKTGTLLGVFCGADAPVNISAVGLMWIYFKSSQPDTGEVPVTANGFKAEYTLEEHSEINKPSGTVYSPLYPKFYTKTGQFNWRITVKFGYVIAITIKDLSMEFSDLVDDFCYSASITFYDGYDALAPLLYQLCSLSTTSFKTTSNVIYISASMDITRKGSRFAIDWLQVESVKNDTTATNDKCGGNEVININPIRNYTLKSPGYPDGYAHYLNCEWIFSTIPENHLQIDFYTVDLEYTVPCLFDVVEVYSGKGGVEDWQLLSKICLPNDTYRDTIESTNLMKVVFKTDSYMNLTGFNAMVTEMCGGFVQKSSGIITVNNSTFSHMYSLDCQWNISVRSGRTMKIKFLTFDIAGSSDPKCNNYILLKNGQSADSPILGSGKYCGDTMPPTLQTTSNHLYVKFSTKTRVKGFTMEYSEVSVDCDTRITLTNLDSTATISSLNYPNIPLPHTECKWIISTIPGEALQIDFIDRFDLTDTTGCDKEYVEVRNGGTIMSPLIGRYCKTMPSSIVTKDNMAFIKFFTDVEDPKNGFRAKITIAKCGGTIRDTTGEIKSRFFNNKKVYPKNEDCSWEIEGPEGHFMIFNFETLDLRPTTDCLRDYVEISEHSITNYSDLNSIGKYCRQENLTDIQTSSNKIRVRFATGPANTQAAGFWLKFKTSKEKCGGTLTSDFGYITSPRYPVMFPTKCEWIIRVTKGRSIQVEMLDLDFDTSQPSQGLAFTNAESFLSHITLVKAGDKIKYVNSTDNTMSIFFWALYPSNHRGFKLKYSSDKPTVCIGDFSLPKGTITTPANLSYYYCSWKRIETDLSPKTLALRISTNSTGNSDITPSSSKCKASRSYLIITAGSGEMELGELCPLSAKYEVVRTPYPKTELIANQVIRTKYEFTVEYETYQCGGIVKGPSGNITSPGFPKRTSDTIECAWLIELPKEQTVKVKFQSLDLGDDCDKSFVIIYNGNLNTSPRLGKYCRNTYPENLQSQSNHLWIEYHSETSNGKGFNITYEAVPSGCGGVFHDTTRLIQSPSYPNSYPENAECIWEVRCDEGYHIGLEFLDRFQIEKSDGCKNDYFQVWDYINDDWKSLGRLCGRDVPKFLNSSSTQMKIMFRSNEKTSGAGFKAKWVLNCGGIFNATSRQQYIKSPGYPNNYHDDLDCVYNISAPGNHIIIKFDAFNLEMGTPSCPYDSLTITYNLYGAPTTKTYCSNNKPPILNVKNHVSIRFKTDMFVRKSGFIFSFVKDTCGTDVSTPIEISSPSFIPNTNYIRPYKCYWNVTAPKDKVVAIRFNQIDTQDSRYCWFNYVSLYDGNNTKADSRLAKLCGNLTNSVPVIKSNSNQMVVEYRSYNGRVNTFKASVYFTYGSKSGCGGMITLDSQNKKYIETPNLQGELDCQWIVQAPDDYYINVELQKLPMCQQFPNTTTRYLKTHKHLQVRNGASHFSELLVDFCGNIETIKKYSTSGSEAFIEWSTLDNKSGNDKFKLQLSVSKSKCGSTYLMANETVASIISPNFPNSYPDNIQCVWKINSTVSYRSIHLKAVSFDLGQDDPLQNCVGDRLEVVDRNNRKVIDEGLGSNAVYYFGEKSVVYRIKRGPVGVHRYCGKTSTEFDYYSEDDAIVSFYSGGGAHGKGFKLEYSTVGVCRNYTTTQGRLYNHNVNDCNFTITTPENTTISMYFTHFGMSSASDCSTTRMEIYDGNSGKATKLGTLCNYVIPNPIFSTKNQLHIQIHQSASSYAFYDITYTSTTEGRGCGGKIYNYYGSFTSPLYPNNYRNISHCTWEVTVPYGLRISLKFTVFDIKAACSTDFVTVTTYQDGIANSQKYCQTDALPIFESLNQINVEYNTSFNNGGTGWIAEFKSVGEDETVEW